MDDRAIDRLLRMELGRLHAGIVRAPRPLADLLGEDRPVAPTPDGPHEFDRDALSRLAASVSPVPRAAVRLPILAFLDAEAPGSAYVADETAARAIRELGVPVGEARAGKSWASEPLLRDLARRFPTCLQFVLL